MRIAHCAMQQAQSANCNVHMQGGVLSAESGSGHMVGPGVAVWPGQAGRCKRSKNGPATIALTTRNAVPAQ